MKELRISQEKYNELQEEVTNRETTLRSKINEDIKTAKEFGDLSENAEYSSAREAQGENERRIMEIKDLLLRATVIDETAISTDTVGLGTIVTVFDIDENEEVVYSIVNSLEASSRENKLSEQSPIGKALHGRKAGETVTVTTPSFSFDLKILNITK